MPARFRRFLIVGFLLFLSLYPNPYTLTPTFADWTLDLDPPSTIFAPAPSCTNCANGEISTISLACSDTGGSGCRNTYYTVDGSTPGCTAPATLYSGPFPVSRSNQTITL